MKVLFLFPYPVGKSPSQRFRFEQYLESLKKAGIEFDLAPFWGTTAWPDLYRSGRYLQKAMGLLRGTAARFMVLFTAHRYQFVFIHREVLPLGPPVMEWLLSRVIRKKIIYDFDDAIWLPNTSEENRIVSSFKWHSKVKSICRWSHKVSCGNSYLAAFAKQFNASVIINPSTIDTERLHNPAHYDFSPKESGVLRTKSRDTIALGWTGTHSTLKYIDSLVPVLQQLESAYPLLRLVIIANKMPSLAVQSLTFLPWTKEHEIEDLLKLDIGIMPLSDDVWARGKCGFKALQYMALGIPAVVSPVGVNTEIIEHGVNGFLCSTEEEWLACLKSLIDDPALREQVGRQGRKRVIDHYSVLSNTSNFLSLFE
jgi:glycosyltransferase involved in cell wall biosynthesis